MVLTIQYLMFSITNALYLMNKDFYFFSPEISEEI